MRAVLPVAPDDQRKAGKRNQRKQRAIAEAKFGNCLSARIAESDEAVGADKNHQPEDKSGQTHT